MTKFRPYQLVRVQEDGYAYVGEAMSFETPTHTVMVRRVPGHPGTLEEQPVTKLTPSGLNPRTVRVHYAIIKGSGSFPIDMLRYDSCAPVNFTVDPSADYPLPVIDDSFGSDELIVAKCCAPSVRDPWTAGRWASFSWGIRPIRTERIAEE